MATTCELMNFVNLNCAFPDRENLIMMSVLNTLQRLMSHGVPSEDIVVGVMWSGVTAQNIIGTSGRKTY